MAASKFYRWSEITGSESDAILRREIVGIGASLKHVVVPAGTRAERHEHAFEQFIQVLSGSGVLECAAGSTPLKPGTVIHLPPGSWHSAVFETETVLVEVNLDR